MIAARFRAPWFSLILAIASSLLLSACYAKEPASAEGPPVNEAFNQLILTNDGRILWNDQAVTKAQLASLMKRSTALPAEPELRFSPEPGASYDLSAQVLQIIKDSGASKLGFIGNERYAEDTGDAAK